MSFDVNTNISSLQAQGYLNKNTQFQAQTINEVTSGLRIVNSGDDAAGLAIANGYRSNQAVLSQGVRNANDGLSQLQIADGGISNISQLLDRARTLATQSASGTFTGDRGTLNSEFQSVIGEINRQAQAIGLNQGGSFAKNVSVFIGGGKTSGSISAVQNGSVSVNLSQSTVDAQSLGLQGVQAIGAAGTDIGPASSGGTSVSSIVGNAANVASEATGGFTSFTFQGPGFSNNNPINVSVNLTGVTDDNTLVTAINTAIQNAGNGATQQATAFKNAGVSASLNTDASGKTQLTFDSSSAAFQVEAGDRISQALLGNFAQNATLTGADKNATVATNGGGNSATLDLTINGTVLSPITVTSGAATSKAQIVRDLNANSGFNAVATASLSGNQVVIKSNTNSSSSAVAVGTVTTLSTNLGLTGTAAAASASTGADVTTQVLFNGPTAAGTTTFGTAGAGSVVLQFQGSGLVSPVNVTLTTTAAETVTQALTDLSSQVTNNASLKAAGITLTSSTAADALAFTSNSGQSFNVAVTGDVQNLLGGGSFLAGTGNTFDYSALTASAQYNNTPGTVAGTADLEFSINGAASAPNLVSVDLGQGDATAATVSATANTGTVNIGPDNNQLNLNVNGTGTTIALNTNAGATLNDVANQITNALANGAQAGTIAGPYTFNGANHQLSLKVDGGAQQDFTLTSGTAASVVSTINATLTGAVASVNSAGGISITSNSVGSSSSVQILANGTSTANTTLGLTAGTLTDNQVGAASASVVANQLTLTTTNKGANQSILVQAGSANTALGLSTATTPAIGTARSGASIATALNAAFAANSTLQGAGLIADFGVTATGKLSVTSNNGTFFRTDAYGSSTAATVTGTAAPAASAVLAYGTGSQTGTFAITGSNNILSLQVDGGSTQTITLTQGGARTGAQVVQDINNQLTAGSAQASLNASGNVVVTSLNAGNVAASSTSIKFLSTVAATSAAATGSLPGAFTVATGTHDTLNIQVDGGTTQTVVFANTVTDATGAAAAIQALNGGAGLAGATATASAAGNAGVLIITSNSSGAGSGIVIAAGDANSVFGFGTDVGGVTATPGANAVDSAASPLGFTTNSVAGTNTGAVAGTGVNITSSNQKLLIALNGGNATNVTLTTATNQSASTIAGEIQTQLGSGAVVTAQNGRIQIASAATGAGASVSIQAISNSAYSALGLTAGTTTGTQGDLGYGITGATFVNGNTATAAPATATQLDSGGANQTASLAFTPITTGNGNQTISINALDSTGVTHSLSTLLQNNATSRSGQSIDSAINSINTALQQSNDTTLQSIVAVKENVGGVQQIGFLSSTASFKVSVGTTAAGTGVGSQGTTDVSAVTGGGSTANISTQAGALAAVNVLGNSVALLGSAQAVVGRGENQFNYAINLANSQLTNLASAESQIRDADLAAEAANLTKAQILVQAGVAALAQANSAPQAVLSLLKG